MICTVSFDIIKFGKNGTIYNTGSGAGYTINNVLENIKTLLEAPLSIEYLPFRPFDVRYNVLNSSAVSSLNNWSPSVSLKDGLQTTIEWIQDLK